MRTKRNERVRVDDRKEYFRVAADDHIYYDAFAHQLQFHHRPAKYRLFGGAAGPGKTMALLYEAIRQAHNEPGSDSLLLRRTYPELESSLLAYFRRDVPRAGFVLTYLNAWPSMGMGLKLGFICSAAAWFVGARFSKIYR